VPGRSLPGLVSNSPTASLTLGSLRDLDRLRFLLWLLLWLRGSGLYDNRAANFLLYGSLKVQRRLLTPGWCRHQVATFQISTGYRARSLCSDRMSGRRRRSELLEGDFGVWQSIAESQYRQGTVVRMGSGEMSSSEASEAVRGSCFQRVVPMYEAR
jgi:hypothetical protein